MLELLDRGGKGEVREDVGDFGEEEWEISRLPTAEGGKVGYQAGQVVLRLEGEGCR